MRTNSGFSLIDLVENTANKKRYAVKRITCHSIEDQRNALREVEIHHLLKHPNIVKVYDSSVTGNADIVVNTISHVNIILPFFRNGSLQDHLNIR